MPQGYNPYDDSYNQDPWNTDPGGTLSNRWWLNPWGIWGMQPPPFGYPSAGGGGIATPAPTPNTTPQEPPAQPNEGQTVETPEGTPPSEDGTFSTDVYGGAPSWALPLGLGAGGLGAILAGALGGSGGQNLDVPADGSEVPNFSTDVYGQPPAPGGGEPPTFSATGYGFADPSYSPFTGEVSPGGGTSLSMNPFVQQPGGGSNGGGFPVSLFPWLGATGGLLGGLLGGGGGGSSSQPSQGQQTQQPGSQAPATVPFLAAQGGTSAIPAPYAQLPPHAPVGPVFKPQAHSRPVLSLGELLGALHG